MEENDPQLEKSLEDTEGNAMLEVRKLLKENNLSDRGSDLILKSRLALFGKEQKRQPKQDQPLDFLIVVDFEATCQEDTSVGSYEQEIIEFPAVLVDMRQKIIVAEFHSYVRPEKSKILSNFCTTLTGITQEMVDAADPFPLVLRRFDKWLSEQNLLDNTKWCIVTDGSFDIALFLYCTCKINGLPVPAYFKLFVHLPKFFQWIYLSGDVLKRRANMREMLEHLALELEGRHHSGIDDARNLARICVQMLVDGVQFRPTDVVDVGSVDEKKAFCAKVLPIHKNKWLPLHSRQMAKIARRYQSVQQ